MKKSKSLYISLSFLLLVPFVSMAQENVQSIRVEIALANLQDYSTMDGHKLLIEYRRNLEKQIKMVAGFSLSQSINEVMSYDPQVVNNPEQIREGYNGSSLDFFAGLNFNLLENSNFSVPIGLGLTPRLRTESYPDPESDLHVEPFTTNENGERVYAVMTETIYKQSFDVGLYGTFSVGYSFWDNWEISLQSRYQVYTVGFSVFSTGLSASYNF